MRLDLIQKMVADVVKDGGVPRTLLLTPKDAEALNIPTWTRQFMGMKVVIASNILASQVSPHIYDTVSMKKTDERHVKEYQEQLHAKYNQ